MKRYIFRLNPRLNSRHIGSKAANLAFLIRSGYPVPQAYVCIWDAFLAFRDGDSSVPNILRAQLSGVLRDGASYAVRSSADVEDDRRYSFAGQFRSILRVSGADNVLKAVMDVWDSAEAPEVLAYAKENGIATGSIRMAVIIQEMVPANFSGTAFSRNPATGLSETIIEGGPGTADRLASIPGMPEHWVSKWDQWLKKPDSPAIPEDLAVEVVRRTSEIAGRYGGPVDIEWASAGGRLQFLQVRRITALDIPVFSSRISREMVPGLIKPLVWSVNTRLNNGRWTHILRWLSGEKGIRPEELTVQFYYRAYFNMAIFGKVFERLGMPRDSLEMMLGVEAGGPARPHYHPGMRAGLLLPRFLTFACSFFFLRSRLERADRRARQLLANLNARIERASSPEDLDRLAEEILRVLIPVVDLNIRIPLLATMYNKLLARALKKNGVDAGLLSVPVPESPHSRLEILHRRYFSDGKTLSGEKEAEFREDIRDFLEKYGHFSDSGNDFSSRPWRETPDLIVRMAERGISGKVGNDGRQPGLDSLRLPLSRRMRIRRLYRRACAFADLREKASSLYTYGYGLFRPCFLRMADLLIGRGLLGEREDIFYLYRDEVRSLFKSSEKFPLEDRIRERRAEMDRFAGIPLPETIFGTEQPPIPEEEASDTLWGIPTSLGVHTGPARVMNGLADFEKLEDGDVLVIPYSDIGWTPLFGKAGAVVAESGGILSHSSIVAREYHIPAVVSVPGACRIADGTILMVNGQSGEVRLGVSANCGFPNPQTAPPDDCGMEENTKGVVS